MIRFWSKVDKSGGDDACWEWLSDKIRTGYGQFRLKDKKAYAHRVAFELTYGPIPPGLCVCHTCDNPGCVNPEHLFLGTHTDNLRDMCNKGRGVGQKLSWDDVREIRRRLAIGKRGIGNVLAREFDVAHTTISKIKSGIAWKLEGGK